MGFHLEIHGDTAAFVKQLRANPSSVFGRPYGGYLLFLFDDYGPERKLHEWIQNRAKALDAITGGSIAFALFFHPPPDVLCIPEELMKYRSVYSKIDEMFTREIHSANSVSVWSFFYYRQMEKNNMGMALFELPLSSTGDHLPIPRRII